MRQLTPQLCTASLRVFTRPAYSQVRRFTDSAAKMSTGTPSTTDPHIENTHIQIGPGVTLSDSQRTIVGSVLDLFAGRPSLPKLALWRDDATFADNLTIAEGRERYSAQWYGLQQVFSETHRLSQQVTDGGNPILMDLRTRYVIRGINKEQTIQSVVAIYLDEQGKIKRVEDRWNGELPDGSIAKAFRRLNAVTVPKLVSVPKDNGEDAKKGNQ